MRTIGLHAQIWASAETLVEALPKIERLGVTVVLDHMACPNVERGSADPIFQRLLSLISAADIWVKLSVCRVSKGVRGYADARPFHDAFLGAARQRCVWGSDWPYVRMSPEPDAGHLCDLVIEWCGDADTQRRVLVDNPAQLYGFTEDA